METTFIYTKQEVQEFLGTKTTVNNNLIDGLERKGYEATTNRKRGVNLRFILNKELGTVQQEPPNKEKLYNELKENKNARYMTFRELDKKLNLTNSERLYAQLVKEKRALPVKSQQREWVKANGKLLTAFEKQQLNAKTVEIFVVVSEWIKGSTWFDAELMAIAKLFKDEGLRKVGVKTLYVHFEGEYPNEFNN